LDGKTASLSGPTAFFVNHGVIKRADAYAAIESGIQQGGWAHVYPCSSLRGSHGHGYGLLGITD
jgi:hypothetical protein